MSSIPLPNIQKSKQLTTLTKQSLISQYSMISPISIEKYRQKHNNQFIRDINNGNKNHVLSSQSQGIGSSLSSLSSSSDKQIKKISSSTISHTNKDIERLSALLNQKQHNEQHYQLIDDIFTRLHLSFFQNIRLTLMKQQYYELISKCFLYQVSQNKIISKKSHQDKNYYVLLDGVLTYNEEKIILNTTTGFEQTQYSPIAYAQNGQLLNSETLNAPKRNIYTILTHSNAILITFNSSEIYSKILKKPMQKQIEQKAFSLSNTSLFKGISAHNIKKLIPYFFTRNFYKFNENIYRQEDKAQFVYWILEGQMQLVKQQSPFQSNQLQTQHNSTQINHNNHNNTINTINKQPCKIVKLSKYQIFGIDQYVFKNDCKYVFTARVCSQSLKTLCISYKSLAYIQNSYPCINQNIDFYLKRTSAMHSKICQKNHRIMENKQNIRCVEKRKKNKKNKKKKKNPQSLEWWGLAQNTVGNKKYKLQLPKFQTLQSNSLLSSKSHPMFDSSNYRQSKIQQFRKKILQHQIDQMIQDQQRQKSIQDKNGQSPYKMQYVPKLNKLKVKMLDIRPKAIDNAQKVKKKLLSYAKNTGSFCDKLNLE